MTMTMKDRSTVICMRDAKILLVARSTSRWSLPGGRIKPGETPLAAAQRELEEEISVSNSRLSYQFQFGGLRKRHYVFFAELPDNAVPLPGNEIILCQWFSPAETTTLHASIPTREIVALMTGSRGRGPVKNLPAQTQRAAPAADSELRYPPQASPILNGLARA
jgi:8-oxo-dGTP diphosphatase